MWSHPRPRTGSNAEQVSTVPASQPCYRFLFRACHVRVLNKQFAQKMGLGDTVKTGRATGRAPQFDAAVGEGAGGVLFGGVAGEKVRHLVNQCYLPCRDILFCYRHCLSLSCVQSDATCEEGAVIVSPCGAGGGKAEQVIRL
jgi:hypothetical protein